MNISDCYYLGRVTKPWGVKGQMALFLDVDNPDDYQELDSAFVEVKGKPRRLPSRPPRWRATSCTCRSTCCPNSLATSSISTRWWASRWSTACMAT